MAVHTKHPVAAAPAAPARERTGHLLLRAWCVFVLFQALTGAGWVHTVGAVGTAIVVGASGVASGVVWIVVRPYVNGRRLPWFVLAYVGVAAASVLWSAWPGTTAITWSLLAITTVQGLFVASVLTWNEAVAALAAALKWVLALSALFELAEWVLAGRAILPGPAQGVFGDVNALAFVALLALIVFAIRLAAGAPRRAVLICWGVLAALLFLGASSANAYLAAAAVALVLATMLLMRTVRRPGGRTKYYVLYALVGVGGALAVWLGREPIFAWLGRTSDLTGRETIWRAVLERADERPVAGWGFASPWLPWDPAFDAWIVDSGETVTQAHSVWVDLYLQLGVVGIVLVAGIYLSFVWRSWFFAIDRPRWDLRADRPYSPLTLLPTLVGTVLLVQGLAESAPLLAWGWMLVVMLGVKVTQAPLVGVGPAEQSLRIELGEHVGSGA